MNTHITSSVCYVDEQTLSGGSACNYYSTHMKVHPSFMIAVFSTSCKMDSDNLCCVNDAVY